MFKAWKEQRKHLRKKNLKEDPNAEEYFGMVYSPVKEKENMKEKEKLERKLRIEKSQMKKNSWTQMKRMMKNFVALGKEQSAKKMKENEVKNKKENLVKTKTQDEENKPNEDEEKVKKENQPETSEAKKMTVEKSVKNDNTYLQVDLTKKVVDFKFERQENFEKIRRKFEENPKCTGK